MTDQDNADAQVLKNQQDVQNQLMEYCTNNPTYELWETQELETGSESEPLVVPCAPPPPPVSFLAHTERVDLPTRPCERYVLFQNARSQRKETLLVDVKFPLELDVAVSAGLAITFPPALNFGWQFQRTYGSLAVYVPYGHHVCVSWSSIRHHSATITAKNSNGFVVAKLPVKAFHMMVVNNAANERPSWWP